MKKRGYSVNARLIVGLLCGLLSVSATASASYLCVPDMATGFAFDKSRQRWHTAECNIEKKYLVSKATGGKYPWEVKVVGDPFATAVCDDFTERGALACGGGGGVQFSMNKQSLRFLLVYRIGYWTDTPEGLPSGVFKEGENTPYMAIGKCSPL